ncbi:MAG: small multi-drug export protein [Clostridia bacterium]|nr:small multi-drug export protein [Clostridia bacterium]
MNFLEKVFGDAHAAVVFLGSMIPVTEQRATIPIGINVFHMSPLLVFLLALIGSLIPTPFLILFFRVVLEWLKRFRWLDWFTGFLENRIRKNVHKFEKKAEWGLIIFIAIPLPGTGVWTGSAVASTIGFDFKKAQLCVVLGGLISAVALTAFFSIIRYREPIIQFLQNLF